MYRGLTFKDIREPYSGIGNDLSNLNELPTLHLLLSLSFIGFPKIINCMKGNNMWERRSCRKIRDHVGRDEYSMKVNNYRDLNYRNTNILTDSPSYIF